MQRCQITGDQITESGIYSVRHAAHRLPAKVILIAGEKFPRCARCSEAVSFEIVLAANAFSSPAFTGIRVYELPVIEDGEAETESSL
jgi:hypothetical protein